MPTELINEAPTFWTYASEFLKLVPGLVLLPISFVVGWKKIGHKAVISYYESHEQFQASRLTRIVLTNLKDKPLIVHALYADIDHHALLKIKEFETPLVVKGLESAVIETDPVSSYHIEHDPYDPPFSEIKSVYVITTGKRFRCLIDDTPSLYSIARGDQYKQIKAKTFTYLGLTFDSYVRYGLSFEIDGKRYVALVGRSGFIGGNWPLGVNMLGLDDMKSPESVKQALDSVYGDIFGQSLLVHELNTSPNNPFSTFMED
ncbi:hypothetical protein K2E96_08580 [Pseudomonas sp. ERGC3:05]|nr:hypothetical protein [Pseudomonas sp. ERGC3:01]QZC96106.1 hypothetical protein K2E96_08580 [Pseudomonas sp. ERGC3:05]